MNQIKILVAEDNKINQVVIEKVLKRLGFESELAENGLEVLDKLNEATFDIILMDLQMPEMDGLEATHQIRKILKEQPVIIAMTANAMQSDREICLAAGMDDYLSKPVRVEKLMEKLSQLVKQTKV